MGSAESGSFSEFYRSEWADLLRYCWGLTVDRHDAFDVAQETMTRACCEWSSIAGAAPVAWTRTVALNLSRNRWRSAGRRASALDRLRSRSSEGVDLEPSARHLDVVRLLKELPPRQREAVVLRHLGDYTIEDVATAMNVSVATAKTHLQRGRAALEHLDRATEEARRE